MFAGIEYSMASDVKGQESGMLLSFQVSIKKGVRVVLK